MPRQRTGTASAAPKRPRSPKDPAKAEKLRLEAREDDKALWDRVERLGGKMMDAIVKVGPALAGAGLGYVAFTPFRFDNYKSDELLRTLTFGATSRLWTPGHGDYDRYKLCLFDCRHFGGDPITCPKKCRDAYEGFWTETEGIVGFTITWRLSMKVYCYLHTLAPNLVVDIKAGALDLPWPLPDINTPGIYWSLRETLAFDLSRDITVFTKGDPVGDPGLIGQSQDTARRLAEKDVTRLLQLAGALGGFTGTLTLPEILKGVGDILKGVGEIVPG